MKRLLTLNGIAALMVVLNHTASYGFNAMFFWADRYSNVIVPTFAAIGTLTYYILFFIHHLAGFAIPAFLFVSAYFVAFTARTSAEGITWEYVKSRIKKLIPPFIIWSVIVNVLLLRNFPPTAEEVLRMYYYIPLIAQYYLLSPLIIRLAKHKWQTLVFGSAIIQLGIEISVLLRLLNINFPGQSIITFISPVWLFPGHLFFFSTGVVVSVFQGQFSDWINKHRWFVFGLMLFFLVLSLIEYTCVSKVTEIAWLVPHYSGAFKALFSMSLVLCFFAFDNLQIPFTKVFSELGSKSLGIYLMNTPAIYIVAFAMYHLTPWILSMQLLYQSILILTGLGIPIILMTVFRKPRLRRVYSLVFG